MRRLVATSLAALLCAPAFSAISSVRARPSADSAFLFYRTNDGVGCTLQVAEDDGTGTNNLTPLVTDVDTGQFAGANSDLRPLILGVQQGAPNSASNPDHVFYIGSPVSAANLAGNYVSRALRPYWKHNYLLTCGGSTASGSFYTQNIAWGIGNEAVPWSFDRTAGNQSYLTFTSDRTKRATTLSHDPLTGALDRPVTMAGDITAIGDGSNFTNKTLASAAGTGWSTPGNILLNTPGTYATYTAGTNDVLAVCASASTLTANATTYSTSAMRLNVGGHSANGTGDNDTISVAFTTSCGGANTPYGAFTDILLPTSDGVQCLPTCGAIVPIDTSWGTPPPITKDIRANSNVGFLIKKKGTDTISPISLYQAKVDFIEDDNYQFFTEGSQMSCSPKKVSNSSGVPGAVCGIQVGAASTSLAFYWFNLGSGANAGAAKFLWAAKIDTAHLVNGSGVSLGAGKNAIIGVAGVNWDWSKLAIYNTNTDSVTGVNYVVEGDLPASGSTAYDNDNAPNTSSDQAHGWTWTNLTPNPNDLNTQVAAFNASFDKTHYKCGLYSVEGDGTLGLTCPYQGGSGTQNISAWLAQFKPNTGVVGVEPLTGIAGLSSKTNWCGEHSSVINDLPTGYQTEEPHSLNGSSLGQGPYTMTLTSCSGSTDCVGGVIQPGSSGDILTLNLSGQPTSPVAPTSLNNIAVNDVVQFGTASTGEWFSVNSIITTSPLQITAYRGVNGCPSGGCTSQANGQTLQMTCSAGNVQSQSNGTIFFHYNDDPNGANPTIDYGNGTAAPFATPGSTVTGNHQDIKQGPATIPFRIGSGYNTCHESDIIHCPNGTNWSPDSSLLGNIVPSCGGNCAQSHPSASHEFAGPVSDFAFGHDARPFSNGLAGRLNQTPWTQVSGSLYRTSPATFAIGSGLTSIVVSGNVATITTTSNTLSTCEEAIITGSSTAALNGIYPCATESNTTTSTVPTSGVGNGTYNNAGLTVRYTNVHHEFLPMLAFTGNTPLVDVSATGAVLTGNAGDNNKVCVPHTPGDCNPGSFVGEIYINIPGVPGSCNNYIGFPSSYPATDACVGDMVAYMHSIPEIREDRPQTVLQSSLRIIAHPPALFHTWSLGAVSTTLPARDGNGCLWTLAQLERRERIDVHEFCAPPIAPDDTYNRQFGFIPYMVNPPASGIPFGATKWDVKFGYDMNFDCLLWAIACHAVSSTINVNYPFYLTGDTYTLPATSSAIALPLRSQQAFFYQRCYYNSGGTLLGCGATEEDVTP